MYHRTISWMVCQFPVPAGGRVPCGSPGRGPSHLLLWLTATKNAELPKSIVLDGSPGLCGSACVRFWKELNKFVVLAGGASSG